MYNLPSEGSNNPNNDTEVVLPPDDTVSSMEFSPRSVQQTLLVAGSWDCRARCWEIDESRKTNLKASYAMDGPILDVAWHDDGTKVFMASADKTVKCWDLAADKTTQVAAHEDPVMTCHWIKAPNYCSVMTTSWDKTVRFWDTRNPVPVHAMELSDRCSYACVDYPTAIICTSDRALYLYDLEGYPAEIERMVAPTVYQHRCIALFRDKKMREAIGYALGCTEGRTAIQYLEPLCPADNYNFKCHRKPATDTTLKEVFSVNDVAFHPVHGTLATVGSDGCYNFWDKNTRMLLKSSKRLDQPVIKCAFNHTGQLFAYAVGYDYGKDHEYYDPTKKNYIYLRPCFEELKPHPLLTLDNLMVL